MAYSPTDVSGVTVSDGSASSSAGKNVNCSTPASGRVTCALYGLNENILANGVIANVAVQLASGSTTSSVPIGVSTVSGSDGTGSPIASSGTGGTVTRKATAAALSGIACSPSTVVGPTTSTCTVTLSAAAASPFTATLSSSDAVVAVPTSVSIAAGASSAQFSASAAKVTTGHSAVITASAGGVSKSATVQDSAVAVWSASGNAGVAPGGTGVLMSTYAYSTSKSQTTTTDSVGNYAAQGLPDGMYLMTPSKSGSTFTPTNRTFTVSGGNIGGLNFSSTSATNTSAIGVDVRFSVDRSSPGYSVASTAFSNHSANQLLLAFIASDSISTPNVYVTKMTGAGLTWTRVARTNTEHGTSEIWRAFAPTVLTNVSVAASLSQSVVSSMTVVSFTGVNTSGTGGSGAIGAVGSGAATSGAPSASLTTTKNQSVVIGVGNDYDNAIGRTTASGQFLVHQVLSRTGDTYWVQMLNSPVPNSGTRVTMSDSAPTSDQFNMSICEILPAGGN